MTVGKLRLLSSHAGLEFGELEVALVVGVGDAGLALGFEGAETAELVGVGGEVSYWGFLPGLLLG
jgi:hypothetical protein